MNDVLERARAVFAESEQHDAGTLAAKALESQATTLALISIAESLKIIADGVDFELNRQQSARDKAELNERLRLRGLTPDA